jgi:DeoR/GlpR family transcriptional regulator of sugar metabolism
VADSSKFGRKSLTLVAGLDAVDVVVSDEELPQPWRDFVTRVGAELIITDVAPADAADPRPTRKHQANPT